MLYRQIAFIMFLLLTVTTYSFAGTDQEAAVAQVMELWRKENYATLYDNLADRKKFSREEFSTLMGTSPIKPACCHRQIKKFQVMSETSKTSNVYVTIGLDGTGSDSVTKEFSLVKIDGQWYMKLSEVLKMAKIRKAKSHYRYRPY